MTATAEGDGPSCPAQKPRGDFLASLGEMPSNGDGRRCWAAAPRAEAARGICGVAGARCRATATAESVGLPRPAQKPREDFLASLGEMPSNGGRPKMLFRCAPRRSRARTSWRRWARCRTAATAEGVWPPRSTQKSRADFLASQGEMLSDDDGRRYWIAVPHAEVALGLLDVAGRDAERWRRLKVLVRSAPRRSRVRTSWRRWARCQGTATAEGVAPRRPAQKPCRDFLAWLGEMPSDGDS